MRTLIRPEPNAVYDLDEVAEMVGLSRRTVQRYVSQGRLRKVPDFAHCQFRGDELLRAFRGLFAPIRGMTPVQRERVIDDAVRRLKS